MVTLTFTYIVINPFLSAGNWCNNYYNDYSGSKPGNFIFLDCEDASQNLNVPYSGITMTLPYFTSGIDIFSLFIFSAIKF